MATVLARGQIGLTDITDAYGVNLSTDSFTFQGDTTKVKNNTQSFTTVVSALQGAKSVTAAVDTESIDLPTGLSVSSDGDASSPTLTFTATTALTDAVLQAFGGAVDLTILVDGKATFHKSINISIALTGATGAAPYSILVGNEAYQIACDKDGKVIAATDVTIPFTIYQGTTRRACTCTTPSSMPTGITVKSNTAGTASADGSLVLTFAKSSALSGDSGTIQLTFKYGSTTVGTKIFTWSKSKVGATGGVGPGALNVVCGNEAQMIFCDKDGKVSGAQTITIPFAGYQGTSRAACTLTDPTLPSGFTKKSNTAATTSANGSYVCQVASGTSLATTGVITLTFTCGGQTFTKSFTYTRAQVGATGGKGEKGDKGNDGEDAYTLVVISSSGTVFKNNIGTKTLTAHIFKGGEEVTGDALTALLNALGASINWYKGAGSTTKLNTQSSITLNVNASDVTDSETFEARMETA